MKKIITTFVLGLFMVTVASMFAQAGTGQADFDNDGDVDAEDLRMFAEDYGTVRWYKDADGDGYSDGSTVYAATQPPDHYPEQALTAISGDCNDDDEDIHPDAEEICSDGVDNNCNGQIDGADADCGACGAYVAPGVWKQFDCYNLAAIGKTTSDDPFTPSWRLNGGYWQWGRKGPDSSQWYNTNTPNFAHAPTGPDPAQANSGAISNWDQTYAPDGAWLDAGKTANDPCPAGYRVPTLSQWQGVLTNDNTLRVVGSWSTTLDNHTNYSAAQFFGNDLMLPAAGRRGYGDGSLDRRGYGGFYWSSTQDSSDSYSAWRLAVYRGTANTDYYRRTRGFSVRCVAE